MIFVDTWAWVALADKSDPYHRKAKAQHRKLLRIKRRYVTTDYVLSETITYL
jgi:predicted nucleic acid-binding protein